MNSTETAGASLEATPIWLARFSKLLVACTLFLVFLGGQVKSNEAGLSVPDWPTSYGENMFLFHPRNWIGGIFHEHVHRLAASTVGLLTVILTVWLALREQRRWLKFLGYGALVAVIAQGLLGGLTVRLLLPTWVSVSHAVLAQTYLLMVIAIAYGLSREGTRRAANRGTDPSAPIAASMPLSAKGIVPRSASVGPPIRGAVVLLALVYLQLILGALMRHTESGLAIPDFPAMGGRLIPWFNEETLAWINQWRFDYSLDTGQDLEPVTLGQVLIHFAHRTGALVVTMGACVVSYVTFRRRNGAGQLWRTAALLDGVLLVQIGLGASTVWTHKTPVVTSFHVMTGAAVLGMAALLVLRSMPRRVRTDRALAGEGEFRPLAP